MRLNWNSSQFTFVSFLSLQMSFVSLISQQLTLFMAIQCNTVCCPLFCTNIPICSEMTDNTVIRQGDFNSSLLFLIHRFHAAVNNAAPCNLPRVTVEGGSRVLEK